jgi:hypothetical protein
MTGSYGSYGTKVELFPAALGRIYSTKQTQSWARVRGIHPYPCQRAKADQYTGSRPVSITFSPVKACAWRSSLNSPCFRLRLSASQPRSWSAELQQIDSQLPSVRSPWTRIAIPALTYRHHGRSCPPWWVVIWSGLLRNHSSYILASCPPAEQVLLILRIPS